MLDTLLAKVVGTQNERELKRLRPLVAQINALEPTIKALSDEQLRGKTAEFKSRVANGETLDDLLVEAFAVVREAGRRVLNMIVNVGLFTSSGGAPRPAASPRVNAVLPAPRSPKSSTTAPGSSCAATSFPTAAVSSSDRVTTVRVPVVNWSSCRRLCAARSIRARHRRRGRQGRPPSSTPRLRPLPRDHQPCAIA